MRNIIILHPKALDGEADGPFLSNPPTPSTSSGFLSTHYLPPSLFLQILILWTPPSAHQHCCPPPSPAGIVCRGNDSKIRRAR